MNDNYYKLISEELLIKLNQIKCFVKKHNLTIGILTEEILRNFLTDYLPKSISVSQGFIIYPDGNLSPLYKVFLVIDKFVVKAARMSLTSRHFKSFCKPKKC